MTPESEVLRAVADAHREEWGRVLVVVSMTDGPARALRQVEELETDGRLKTYHYLPAITADLLDRLGRDEEASLAGAKAAEDIQNAAERALLESEEPPTR